ncbi:MAG: sugar ABC transporter permease [Caldilineaceae bacterium]|nr:sugar ABC transporter permease [Caldilineaceae bacterium]
MNARTGKGGLGIARRENLEAYLFLLPWIIGFLVLTIGPILASLGLSFTDWQVGLGMNFIGLENFRLMVFEDDLFKKSLGVTFNYSLMALPAGIVVALAMALLLNQKVFGIGVFRTIYYLPAVTSGVAVAMLWAWIFNSEFGLLNWALDLINVKGPAWLLEPRWALPAFAVMSLWGAGGLMIIYLASLQAIPQNLYEAAQIDGANVVRQFLHVTLPMLTPTILFNLVVGIIAVFQTFTNAYIMTAGGPNFATYFYVLHLYNNAFGYARMGYASALAWVLFVIVLVMTLAVLRTSQYWVFYSGEKE